MTAEPGAPPPAAARRNLGSLLLLPATDAWRGLDRTLANGAAGLVWIAIGLLACWWLYVPAHELLHAAGCRLTGGEVTRVEIAPLYGGAILARFLPFVAGDSEYAGRLSGFDTHGSDAVYLATDFGPYLLTLFPGVWWLRRAARARHPVWRALGFGAALPLAMAPFLSLSGDAYEIGSIVLTRLPPWSAAAARTLLRGDDLGLRIAALARDGAAFASWSGLVLAALAGLIWGLVTYAVGGWLAGAAGQPALEPQPPAAVRR